MKPCSGRCSPLAACWPRCSSPHSSSSAQSSDHSAGRWFADAFTYEGVRDLLHPGIGRAAIGVVVALIAIHACHRLRHLAVDLHAPLPGVLVALVAYGGAVAVAALTAVFLALV